MTRPTHQALFWLAALAALLVGLYVFRHILLPFVLGMAIAYALDPVADRLAARRVPRGLASGLILACFFAAGLAAIVVLVPLLQQQIVNLIGVVPDLAAWLREQAAPVIERLRGEIRPEDVEQLRAAARSYAGGLAAWLGGFAARIWSGGLALVNLLSVLVVTPVVAFYLLRDWDNIVAKVDRWLPRAHADVIRAQVRAIDRIIADYVRGVGLVCLILAAFYGAALTLIGLQYGLVIGIAAGILSFIPFVGAIGGFAAGVGLALFQFPDWWHVILVGLTFVAGQMLEGNVITPRLVGEKVGLHPVWVLFALFAGGLLLGFVGLLLAVPAAAAIGVLVRFALGRYLESPLYLGTAPGSREKDER